MEVDGKLAFIGGDTCLLLERSVTLLTLLATAALVVSPKLFLLGLPGQWRSISGSEIGIAWLATEAEEAVEDGGDTLVPEVSNLKEGWTLLLW